MTYISDERRERITLPYCSDVSELAYIVDKTAEDLLWKLTGYDWANLSDDMLAQIDGALGLAQEEFRRRIVAPYRDARIDEHGDVFVIPHPELWDINTEVDVAPVQAVPDHTIEAEEALAEIRQVNTPGVAS